MKEKLKKKQLDKKLARQEKKAKKGLMIDDHIVEHLWTLVTMWPRIADPELEDRVGKFIVEGKPEDYFRMQQKIFDFVAPLLKKDWRFAKIMRELNGKKIGLEVTGNYSSTVSLNDMSFKIKVGLKKGIPVISVISREDYRDAILKRKDPVRLLLHRRIRIKGILTLIKWVLPYVSILRDRSLYERVLAYQPEFEELLDRELTDIGY